MIKALLLIILALTSWSCTGVPFTKSSYHDDFATGMRRYKRGSYEKAVRYWEPLAEKGDCDAEVWIGMLYFMGQGMPQDQAKAISLWEKAANGNHPKAQLALGDLYYQDDNAHFVYQWCKECNFDKDITKAYVWYMLGQKSARYSGEKDYAEIILKVIKIEMSNEEIVEGDSIVNSWNPTPKDCEPRKWW